MFWFPSLHNTFFKCIGIHNRNEKYKDKKTVVFIINNIYYSINIKPEQMYLK